MSKIINKSQKFIVTMLITIIITTIGPIIALAATETNAPVVTAKQSAGEIKVGSELKFNITDDTKLAYVFYAWNRRIDGNKKTIITLDDEPKQYEFKTTAPTKPGLYEFSIAAQDYYGNISYWTNIPYVVVDNPTGVVDTTKPVFVFNVPDEYPYNNSTIAQEMPITLRASDDSGIYYMAYKWTRTLDQTDYATGATIVYNTNELKIKAPKETGDWYLQIYARDGANNISEGYYTKVTIKDMIAPTLTLNGSDKVDVPLNGTFTDPGATFNDNYDAQKIVYANEKLDTSKVGPQVLTYTATDAAGNKSNTVTRTVTVVGTEKTYELTAPTKTEYNVNDPIDLTGASIKVTDERGNISYVTPTEDMFADFSTSTPNTKQISFTYNGTSIIYEYNVNDFIADISVTPPTKVAYEYQEDLDIEGGYVQKVMASGVNTIKEKMTMDMLSGYDKEKLGEQLITVSYAGKQKTFKVTVKDETKPVISINGANPQIIKKGEEYKELGAIVTDNYDKDLTAIIDATQVDINNVGIYNVTYNVADSSGNIADTVTRKVHIVDYKDLQEKLKYIEGTLIESDYIESSWQQLQEVIRESNDMIEENQSIQTEINEQLIKLENQITSLQAKNVNQQALNEYIETFVSTDYTNWNDFENLVNEAKNITDLQSKFDKKLEEIKDFKLIEKEIEKSALDSIEKELSNLNSEDYTKNSWNSIQEKIAEAKKQTLQSKFDEIVSTINLEDLVKLPKISNIMVSTSNSNASYAKVGDNITITFDTNVELDLSESITKINQQEVALQKINENQYKFTYTLTSEDAEGLISYTIEPKGILENVGARVEENSTISFDKTAPSISFAEEIADVEININDYYEIKNSDVVVADNSTAVDNITIKTNKEILELNKLGDYVINYTAVDEAGNESQTISRTIHVKDYVEDIEIIAPVKTNYIYKEQLDLTGATVRKIMASGTEVEPENISMDMVTGYNSEVIGEQTVTVNYAGKTKEFTVNVDRATYNMSEISFIDKSVNYNGNVQKLEINGTLPEGVTVNYLNNENKNVGEYTVTAKFVGDFEHYKEIPDMVATLKIEKLKTTITIDDKTSAYGDALKELTSRVTEGTVVEGDDLGIVLTKAEGTTVGEYAITGTSSNTNYNVTLVDGTYTITTREVTVTIDDKTSEYGEDLKELTSRVTEGTVVEGDDLGIVLTKAEGTTVGEYAVTGTASNTNYNVTFVNGTYTIEKTNYDMSKVTFEDKEETYDGTQKYIQITGDLPEGVSVTYEGNSGINAGEYNAVAKFEIADKTNYNEIENKTAKLIIKRAEGTLNPDYIDSFPTLESVVYHKDRRLKDITLPTRWTWVDETIVPEIGTLNYKANYTSSNTNYEDVNNVNISLTVLQPADQTELNRYLEEIGYNNLEKADYTNWDEFEKIVEAAKSATIQDNLDILLNKLKDYRLQAKPVDQTKLDQYEQKLEQVVSSDYTNWNELQSKIAEAREITDLQSRFDKKMEEVTSLKMKAKPVDQTALKELRIQLSLKNQDDYSKESWNAVEAKMQQAKNQQLQSKFDEIIASIDLTVDLLPKELESISISELPKVNYEYGDQLDVTGGKIKLIYDNETTEEIAMIVSEVTGYDSNKIGEQVLTVNHLGKTAIYRINVENPIKEISIQEPNKVNYRYGEELDLDGLVVKEILKNNEENTLSNNQYSISGYDSQKLGEQTITVSYKGYEKEFKVTVNDFTESIRIKQEPKTTYKKGKEFDTTGMKVEKLTAAGEVTEIDLSKITVTGYDKDTLGIQKITLTYAENGEIFETTLNVIVAEGTKPVIALKGENNINVEVNTKYEELGATAYNVDEEKEIEVNIGGDVVDTTKKGTYTVIYSAQDAEPVTRTVNVIDTTKPEITLSEENIYELKLNEEKPEYKATAVDNYDGKVEVTIVDNINMASPGNYKVTFTAKDAENNTTVIEKTVIVRDVTKPVISITGEKVQTVEVNTEYKATDVNVTDDSGEVITLNINKNNLNMNYLGTYTVIYSAKDSSGNEAILERTVKVVDTTKPVIHANKTEVSFIIGTQVFDYENAVNVTDNYDKNIRATHQGTVNSNAIGTYKVVYSAVDTSGNKADDVEITVKVTDYAPTISYYNDDNLKTEITDGQVFCKHIAVVYNKGTATIKEQNDVSYRVYNGETLEDGTYTIKVVAEDGTSSQKTFIIDTLPPVVTGIKAGRFKTVKTILFEDINDVAVATLSRYEDGKVIDLKAEGKNSYEVNESGTYTLKVEDKYGNAIMPITFRITLP